jgi:hypothetical protein
MGCCPQNVWSSQCLSLRACSYQLSTLLSLCAFALPRLASANSRYGLAVAMRAAWAWAWAVCCSIQILGRCWASASILWAVARWATFAGTSTLAIADGLRCALHTGTFAIPRLACACPGNRLAVAMWPAGADAGCCFRILACWRAVAAAFGAPAGRTAVARSTALASADACGLHRLHCEKLRTMDFFSAIHAGILKKQFVVSSQVK